MLKGIGWCIGALSVGLSAMGAEDAAAERGTPNRLAKSKSPYLLQHAYNPVDWYPWGEEAFEKARKEKKPILLSIGYSTCHWCHVMERESFQSAEVAEFLNKHFVSIKLDREERPDVDRVYMTAFQAMMGEGGGWPLNMFLTPELKPFFGGTYFPPEDRAGRAGFLSALKQLHGAWTDKNGEVVGVANDIHAKLAEMVSESQKLSAAKEKLSAGLLATSSKALVSPDSGADRAQGGWGRGPKFPQPSHLRFLMRCGDEEGRKFALHTCRKMMAGGIHDQLGGGFHRYAVDGVWLVPHFEKMLYDQAQLLDVYVEAWLLSGEDGFRETAEGIVHYVSTNLTHPEGAFYSAQDAQSEGKEGKYWCWTEKELQTLLEPSEFELVKRWYGVTAKGNFLDHSDPEPLADQNVLFLADRGSEPGGGDRAILASAIGKMKEARSKRVPPATDDKVLASWNGLMIASLARAGRFLQRPEYLEAARRAHACVVTKLWDADKKRLAHRWRDGDVDASQQAESYIYLLRGTRALYEATLDERYLSLALDLAEGARERFYDEENGGFFDGEKREDLVIRMKGDFDSATPTAGSVASYEYLVLAELTGRTEFREIAEKTLRAAVPTIERAPASLTGSLSALDFYLAKPGRLVIAGDKVEEFLAAAWSAYQRNLVVMGNRGPVDAFTKSLQPEAGKTTAFYCVGQVCRLPETDPKEVAEWLVEAPAAEESADPGE